MRFINTTVPIGEEHFVSTIVWTNRADYQTATYDNPEHAACFIAYVITDENDVVSTTFPLIGTVHFIKGELDAGIVAHEFTHVAFHLAKILGKMEDEEYICDTVQEMNRNFWEAVQNNTTLYGWIYEDGYGEEI